MAEEGLEKKHEASSRRIEDLRKKGQSLRSRDLTSGLVFIATVLMLIFVSSEINERFKTNFVWSFTHIKYILADRNFPADFIGTIAFDNMKVVLPVYILCIVAAILSPFLFGGWNFTLSAVHFNLNKFNIVSNLQNMFSVRTVIEVIRSFLKVVLIAGLLIYFALHNKNYVIGLIHQPIKTAINSGVYLIIQFIILMSIGLVFIILFDVLYHFYDYYKRIKMTSQEMRDEQKETDGNPEIKRRLKSAQFALLRQRLSVAVPQANVIITNPTHYAVALRYDESKDRAPRLVAKGKGFIAEQIRALAISHSITIYQAPELARAIYHTANLNAEVAPQLYMSVALVLSYVHQLKHYQQGNGVAPTYVTDLKIPDEFIYNE